MGIFPKIKFQFNKGQDKKKQFCKDCGIRIGTWRKKAIEYSDGFYCSRCEYKRATKIFEKDKGEKAAAEGDKTEESIASEGETEEETEEEQ